MRQLILFLLILTSLAHSAELCRGIYPPVVNTENLVSTSGDVLTGSLMFVSDGDTFIIGDMNTALDLMSLNIDGTIIARIDSTGDFFCDNVTLGNGAYGGRITFGDEDTYIEEQVDDILYFTFQGSLKFLMSKNGMSRHVGDGFQISFGVPSATDPIFIPNDGDPDNGIGSAGEDQISIIAGGVEGINVSESGSTTTATINGGLVIPSGTTPYPDTQGALFLDTDASANGTLMMYSNSSWRTVAAW